MLPIFVALSTNFLLNYYAKQSGIQSDPETCDVKASAFYTVDHIRNKTPANACHF